MGKRMVVVMWFLPLCAVVLVLPAMMLPDIAFAQQPTLVMNPTHGPAGTLIPVLGNAHQALTLLTQMITLAMQNGGEGQEAQLEALTQQIEVLPKPQRGDRKAARLQNDKGLEAFKKKRYEQAVQFFLTAYQLDAGDVEVVNNVGMAYLKTGNLPEAARYLGGALSLAPNRTAAWGNLAEVFARDSRLEEAVAAYALTYRYSKNKDATRRLLEAQTTNGDDPQVMQAAKAALALSLIGRGLKGQPAPTTIPPPQEAERPQQEAASQQAVQSAASRCTGDQIGKMINAGFSKQEIMRLCETTTESPAKGTLSREEVVKKRDSPSEHYKNGPAAQEAGEPETTLKEFEVAKAQPAPTPPVTSPVPKPTPPQEQQPTIAASQPPPGKSGDPAAGKASCEILEPPPVRDYSEESRQVRGNITAAWSGSCVNGLAQGTGTLTWHNEGVPFFTEEFTSANGLVMNAGRAAASDAVNERAVVWKLDRQCPSRDGFIEAIGQVSTDLDLAFPVVADKLLEFGVQFVARSCPSKNYDHIRIALYQSAQEAAVSRPPVVLGIAVRGSLRTRPWEEPCGTGGPDNKPCLRRFTSGETGWRNVVEQRAREAAQRAREAARARREAEEEQERQRVKQLAQQSRQRYDEFTKRAGIDVWLPSEDVLQVNPFVYEGKVVGIVTQFEQMFTKDRGLFGDGLLVSSIPPGRLQQPAHLLLAGRVLGKEPVETPAGGKILLPHLKYEDIYICQTNNPICDDVLFWQRQR